MTTQTKPTQGERAYRTLTIDQATRAGAAEADDRTVELAFSSESPVERWYGTEILSHDRAAVRMDRLNDGAALLVNHDADQHIGVVESARLDGDGVGRAVVRFAGDADADKFYQRVIDGVLRNVSVGYLIHQIEESSLPGGATEIRITDWEPLEVSLVAVPADASVGVGRHFDTAGNSHDEDPEMDNTDAQTRDNTDVADVGGGEAVTAADLEALEARVKAEADARAQRDKDDAEILALGQRYQRFGVADQAQALVDTAGSVEDMRKVIRDAIIAHKPTPMRADRDSYITGGAPRYKRLRAFASLGEEPAYRSGMWARATIWQDPKAQRWCNEHGVRAQSEGVFTKGGAIVPDEMSQAIIDLREEYGIARQLARVYPMSSDTMWIPRRTGGVTATFVGENTEPTADDKAWDQVGLTVKKLGAQTKFSAELAEDAVIDVAEDLASEHAYAFAEKEDDCFFNGDGTSTYGGIYGLRPKIINGDYAAGAIDAASNNDTFAEVTQADLDNLMAALPVYAQNGAQWVCSQPAKALVFDSLAAAAGGTTMTMLGDRPQPSHLGYPIRLSQKMPTSTGDLSNVAMIAFGNFMMACAIGDRRGFTMRLLTERYAELDQLAVVSFERFDIVWHDLGDGTDAGPVVCLIGE